jgi:transcriptional antiterminator
MNAAQAARLRFIDFLLDHYGTVNRAALEDYFGLSTPQVSLDIAEYQKAAPDNVFYDKSGRTYRRAPGFIRTFP